MQQALETRPTDATHWSVRSFARETPLSKSTVHRYFTLFGIQPHRSRHFKLSNDPFFVEKVRDIVGLYLNPPEKALVLWVDEKTQIQALERSQPVLPMGLGYIDGITHDYFRRGATTLFAALDVASGTVIGQCKPRYRHQELLSFLNHIERNVPAELDVHVIKRGSFRNIKSLIERTDTFIEQHNQQSAPFKWTATADAIFEKLARLSKLICGTGH